MSAVANARPWRIMVPALAVVGLFIAWSVYWWAASAYAQRKVMEQRAGLAARGVELSCAQETWGGYPFRFEFDCAAPKLTLKGRGEFDASHVLAVAQAYNPTHVILLIDGPSAAMPAGGAALPVTHGRAIVSLRLVSGRDLELSAEVPDAGIAGLARIGTLQLFQRPGAAAGTLDVAARLKDATLTPPGRPPVTVKSAQAIATLDTPRHATISDISADFGAARLWAKGDAGIDDARRPEGRITLATNDLKAAMAMLDPQLTLTDQQRAGLQLVFALMGKEAQIELSAHDGALFAGPVKIGSLAPLY